MYIVLIIDDEQLIGDGVKAKLERAELAEISEIHVACGGVAGLRTALSLRPHIVITDMRMPDLDGIQVIRRLSGKLPFTKFILLSGYGDYAYVREAFKFGALDYLLKPAGSAELANQIRSATAAIAEDAKLAAQSERTQLSERLMAAARLNTLLNGAVRRGDAGNGGGDDDIPLNALTEVGLTVDHAAVALFQIGGIPYSAEDLSTVDSAMQRLARSSEAAKQMRLTAFHDGNGSVCAVIDFADGKWLREVLPLLGEIIREARKQGAENAVVSVSETGRPADLRKLYKQAQLAMSSRILRQPCEVSVWQPDLLAGSSEAHMPARKDIDELNRAVDALQSDRIGQWIDRWLSDKLIGTATLEQLATIYELPLAEIRRRLNGRLPLGENGRMRALAEFDTLDNLRRHLKAYADAAKQTASEQGEPEESVITYAENYLKENYNRDVQLTEMANRVSMNYSYFSKLFKERTGLTFTAYLIKVRMEEAKQLLRDPTVRINEVSEKVGYGSLYHFSRAFKNYYGISPKEYRRIR